MKVQTETVKYNEESLLARKRGLEVVEVVEIGKHIVLNEKNLKLYSSRIQKVINDTKPTLIAIERKETTGLTNTWSINEYLWLLENAKIAAKGMEVKVTNGGIEGDELIALYAAHLKQKDIVAYNNFIKGLETYRRIFLTDPKYKGLRESIVKKTKEYLDLYKKSGIDYLNIHWGYPDPDVLKEVVEFVRDYSGFDIVSTEFIKPYNKDVSKKMQDKLNGLKLKCVIFFFEIEGVMGQVLVDNEGKLSKLAEQLKNYIWWHYNRKPRIRSNYSDEIIKK